jgi:D-alanyl-D-alanine dipeptidase
MAVRFLLSILLFSASSFVDAQTPQTLPPIEKQILAKGLVDVQQADPTILVELKYATTDNFMKKKVYKELTRAYLQKETAEKLVKAHQYLKAVKPDHRFLVYDAVRPNSVQYDLWNTLDDMGIAPADKPKYVADPTKGSNHNFGCAVDLTVVDGEGKPLDMGTPFDFFGPLAYPRMEQEMLRKGKLTSKQVANRELLRQAMKKAGFIVNTTEWWHFDSMSKAQAKAKYGMIR